MIFTNYNYTIAAPQYLGGVSFWWPNLMPVLDAGGKLENCKTCRKANMAWKPNAHTITGTGNQAWDLVVQSKETVTAALTCFPYRWVVSHGNPEKMFPSYVLISLEAEKNPLSLIENPHKSPFRKFFYDHSKVELFSFCVATFTRKFFQ